MYLLDSSYISLMSLVVLQAGHSVQAQEGSRLKRYEGGTVKGMRLFIRFLDVRGQQRDGVQCFSM